MMLAVGHVSEDAELVETVAAFARRRGCCVIESVAPDGLGPKWWQEVGVWNATQTETVNGGCCLLPEHRTSMFAMFVGGQKKLSRVPALVCAQAKALLQSICICQFRAAAKLPFLAFRDTDLGCVVGVNCFLPVNIAEEQVGGGGWERGKSKGVMERIIVGHVCLGC